MFSALRTRFGIPGVIATVALVFAMTGGAFAAKYLITSTKQISPSVLKKLKGAAGPGGAAGTAGAQGPAGAAGAAGKDGASGAPGTPGTNGKDGATILAAAAPPDDEFDGKNGDFYIDTSSSDFYGPKTAGSWGTPVSLKGDKGDPGDPWTMGGTLPPAATETGVWGLSFKEEGYMGIAFPVPLPAMGAGLPLNEMVQDGATPPSVCDNGQGAAPSADNPEADPGYLCVFEGKAFGAATNLASVGPPSSLAAETVSRAGGVISLESGGSSIVGGSWAVTACGGAITCPTP